MNFSEDQPKLNLTIGKPLKEGPNAGMGHIKIVITFIERVDGKKTWPQRPYKTFVYCKVKDFQKVIDWNNSRYATDIIDTRALLKKVKERAEKIIEKVKTQSQFEVFFLSGYNMDSIAPHFKVKIAELEKREKWSSAENYNTALRSYELFFGQGVTFDMITAERLLDYEIWYTSQPRKKDSKETKSLTSVGINGRALRHIFKRVIKRGIVPAEIYPFGDGEDFYTIPEGGDDTKKFLETSDKDKFVNWHHEDDKINELHDYAMFSYFGFGMNMADVARLKKSEVFKDHISRKRQKTKNKKKKIKILTTPLHPVMKQIIKRRGKKSLIQDDYVFPILEYGMTEKEIFYRIRDLVDDVNDVLAMIAKDCGFEIRPTSYTLRHTFAWNFMQMGGTTEELQDAFAHGTKQTTENYQHGFALQKKKKFSEGL